MNAKFIGIALLTIAIVGVAWKITEDRAPQSEVTRTTLYPDLIDRLNDIGRVHVRSADKESILVRDGDVWKLESRDGYPAAFTDIKRTILQIADLDVIDAKTSLQDNYKQIGVEDIESDAATGMQIGLLTDASDPIASLIVGRKSDAGTQEQYYVRKDGDAQSWLVSGDLKIASDPLKWVDTSIANIDTNRVRQTSITTAESEPIVISKADAKKNFFELKNIPDGFKVKSKSTVSSIGAILLNLDFKDVVAASGLSDLEPRKTVELQTFDGLVAKLEEFDADEKVLMRFNFSYNPDIVIVEDDDSDTPDDAATEGDEKETVEEEVARLNKRTAQWAYELHDYKTRTIDKRFEDLIEEEEPANEEANGD